jgi:hypothetical protein
MNTIPSDELVMMRKRMQDQAFFFGWILGMLTATALWWLA